MSSFLGGMAGARQTTSSGTSMPITPQFLTNFQQMMPGYYQNLITQAQAPVYGAAQQAQMQNAANAAYNSGAQNLASNLARKGGSLNSGAYGAGLTSLAQARGGQMANYAMQSPLLNQQAVFGNTMNAVNNAGQWAGRPLSGTRSDQTSTTGPAGGIGGMFGSIFGNAVQAGIGGLTGGLMGNLFKQTPTPGYVNPDALSYGPGQIGPSQAFNPSGYYSPISPVFTPGYGTPTSGAFAGLGLPNS